MTTANIPTVLDPTGADLHSEAARLRTQGPATPVTLPGNVTAWSVTRHDIIRKLAADRRVSRDPRQHWPALDAIPADWPLNVWVRVTNAFTSYGDEHRRLRNLISTAFTPRRTQDLRPNVQNLVDTLIHDLRQIPPGQAVDLRSRFAYVIPTEIICDLFGVPDTLRDRTRRVIDAALHTGATPQQAQADFEDLLACMRHLVALKRDDPGSDLTSDLIAARDGQDRLDEEQLVSTLILMIGAGSETAVNLIAQATLALLTHPLQRYLLAAGTVTWEDVIEETLRTQGPIMHMPLRYAVEDIDLGSGVVIRKGEPILLAFGAAGRDPAIHGQDADVFDASRPSKDHLAFGHGVHYCLGAPLAKLEADIALRALFDAFPQIRLAVDPSQLRPQASFIANGHRELPVVLTPAAAASGHQAAQETTMPTRQVTPTPQAAAPSLPPDQRGPLLAPTERATLALVADGLSTAAVATRLGVTEDTVKSTMRRVQSKVGVHGRPALVNTAYRNRQLPAPPRASTGTPLVNLTPEQRTLLQLVATGATVRRIATVTNRSLEAAKSRLKALYTALGANTAAHAVRIGWENGYLGHEHPLITHSAALPPASASNLRTDATVVGGRVASRHTPASSWGAGTSAGGSQR